jgi:curved DNA-binding protein CbpA
MRARQTHYDLLEIPANAPTERIRESYKVLASIWHPDRFPRGSKQYQLATRKLREINAAYEILKDPQRRAEYDRHLIEQHHVSGVYWTLRAQGHYGPPTSFPNLPALLAYALGPISGITLLLIPRYRRNRFIRFHAWQSICLGVTAYLAVELGPLLGLQRPIYWLLWVMAVVLYAAFLMKQAYFNHLYRIPLLGLLAARRAGFAEADLKRLEIEERAGRDYSETPVEPR